MKAAEFIKVVRDDLQELYDMHILDIFLICQLD